MGRQQRTPRTPVGTSDATSRPSRKRELRRERVALAWSGVAFTAVAIAGLVWAPGLRIVWVVLLIFGTSVIPRIAISWIDELRRR